MIDAAPLNSDMKIMNLNWFITSIGVSSCQNRNWCKSYIIINFMFWEEQEKRTIVLIKFITGTKMAKSVGIIVQV